MKTIFIFLIGLSLTACRTLPIEMSDDEVLVEPLEDAEFPEGYEKLQTYIAANMDHYRIENGLSGSTGAACKVIVRFDVEKDGSIRNIAVEKSTGNCLPCEREALRLVRDMPNWTPAKMNGLPILNPVRLPLIFEL